MRLRCRVRPHCFYAVGAYIYSAGRRPRSRPDLPVDLIKGTFLFLATILFFSTGFPENRVARGRGDPTFRPRLFRELFYF